MKHFHLALAVAFLSGGFSIPTHANHFKLPEEIGRVEAPRDLNLIQVEPSMIHERYYTTGQCERRQNVGNVLPEGASIPDSDPAPVKANVQAVPVKTLAPAVVPVKPATE